MGGQAETVITRHPVRFPILLAQLTTVMSPCSRIVLLVPLLAGIVANVSEKSAGSTQAKTYYDAFNVVPSAFYHTSSALFELSPSIENCSSFHVLFSSFHSLPTLLLYELPAHRLSADTTARSNTVTGIVTIVERRMHDGYVLWRCLLVQLLPAPL